MRAGALLHEREDDRDVVRLRRPELPFELQVARRLLRRQRAHRGILHLPADLQLLLLDREEMNRVYLLRTFLGDMPPDDSISFLLKQLVRSKTNREFFQQMAQG